MSAQDDFINGDSIMKAYVVQEPLIFGRIWMSVSFAKIARRGKDLTKLQRYR